MASPTRWTWVWVNSGRWWWTGRPGVLRFIGSQRVGHNWATDLIWSDHLLWSSIKSYITPLWCILSNVQFSSVQSLSRVRLFETPWTAARQVSLSITNSRSPPKLMSIKSVMPSNHLILCRPLLLLPSIFPSIRVFSDESVLHIRWPKYCSFSLNISPSNEHPGLLSFRMDWFDLLAVQGTLKSLLQHHNEAATKLCPATRGD